MRLFCVSSPEHSQARVFRRLAQALSGWWAALVVAALVPVPAAAQAGPPALVVRLRDVAGQGVAGATVTVSDLSGTTILGRATTDAAGVATIGPLPVTEVRVLVQGQLIDGTLLAQPEPQGIAVILGVPALTLELRSEADGSVLPDPATELALEPGVEAPIITLDPASIPQAPPAPAPLATAVSARPTLGAAGASSTTVLVASPIAEGMPPQPAAASLWPGLLLLGALILAIAAVVAVQLRWGRP